MKKKIEFDSGKKVFPIIVSVIGTALMLAMWITRLNMTAVICVGFCCIVSALIVIGMFFKRRLYLGFLIGYCAALFGRYHLLHNFRRGCGLRRVHFRSCGIFERGASLAYRRG